MATVTDDQFIKVIKDSVKQADKRAEAKLKAIETASKGSTRAKKTKETNYTVTELEGINNITGEVHRYTVKQADRLPGEPDYIKIYLKHIVLLNELQGKCHDVLYALLPFVTYSNNNIGDKITGSVLNVNALLLQEVARQLDTSVQVVKNYLGDLKNKQFLLPIMNQMTNQPHRGIYQLNPHFFGRGDWKDIYQHRQSVDRQFDIQIHYSNKLKSGYSISTESTLNKQLTLPFETDQIQNGNAHNT